MSCLVSSSFGLYVVDVWAHVIKWVTAKLKWNENGLNLKSYWKISKKMAKLRNVDANEDELTFEKLC